MFTKHYFLFQIVCVPFPTEHIPFEFIFNGYHGTQYYPVGKHLFLVSEIFVSRVPRDTPLLSLFLMVTRHYITLQENIFLVSETFDFVSRISRDTPFLFYF